MAEVELQCAVDTDFLPDTAQLLAWVQAALQGELQDAGVVVRVVDEDESRMLNARYRCQDKPTNVLSFTFDAPQETGCRHLGDLVICAPVVEHEAVQQGKDLVHHWAHMVMHGVLHLRGMDHQTEGEADRMEALEKQLLAAFGIPDPYHRAVSRKQDR